MGPKIGSDIVNSHHQLDVLHPSVTVLTHTWLKPQSVSTEMDSKQYFLLEQWVRWHLAEIP